MNRTIAFDIIFWIAGVLVISLIYMSGCDSFAVAFLYSSLMLPAMLMANILYKQISFENRMQGIKNAIWLGCAVVVTAYFGLCLSGWYLDKFAVGNIFMLNPVLIIFSIGSLCALNYLLREKIFKKKLEQEAEESVEFTSERRKISLQISKIKYIESNDSEVWVRCTGGESYRTKMNISRWEEFLSPKFVRVHRSFLVNKAHILSWEATQVHLPDEAIPISRKYREI